MLFQQYLLWYCWSVIKFKYAKIEEHNQNKRLTMVKKTKKNATTYSKAEHRKELQN